MRITVVVPTFNSMKYVDQCLDSVLAQTYDDMEVIVYDNESTDGTYEHLKSRKDEGENFELISIPNVYANSFLEAVLDVTKNSKSEYVTFICSDDYVDKNKKGISLQSGLIWVNENGEIVNQRAHNYESIDKFKELCLTYSPVNSPTVVYHRSIWPIIMEVREAHAENDLPEIGVGDYDMWCGLADRGIPLYPVMDYLGYFYRWNPDQCTWKVKENPVDYDKIIQDYWRSKWKM